MYYFKLLEEEMYLSLNNEVNHALINFSVSINYYSLNHALINFSVSINYYSLK